MLETARRLWANEGFEATTMEQVAKAAGTSIGNLYFYFSGKEALLKEVVMRELARHAARVDARLGTLPPGPLNVAVGMYTYLESLYREPDIALMVVRSERHPAVRRSLILSITERIERRLPKRVHELHLIDVRLTAVAEVGAVFTLVSAQMSGDLDATPDEFFRFTTRLRLRIFGLSVDEENATIADAERRIGWVTGRDWTDLQRGITRELPPGATP